MGDFGRGNRVEVQVNRSAFVGHVESHTWSINTDVL
jgi:hypothetical protein